MTTSVDLCTCEEQVDLDHADHWSFRDDVEDLCGFREIVKSGKSTTRYGHSRRIKLPDSKCGPESAPRQEAGGVWAPNMLLKLFEHSTAKQNVI